MNKVMKEMINTLLYLLGVLCLTWFVIAFVGQRTEVDGSSMEPMLSDGDNLIVDKLTYRFKDPERFDIIVFPVYNDNTKAETYFIKRIIGLPGETVWIDEGGNIYINDERLPESYGREIIMSGRRGLFIGRDRNNPIVLEDDEYFVLGDNRNHSTDSREIGNIHRDDIIGRAWVRIWPFSRLGFLKHQ